MKIRNSPREIQGISGTKSSESFQDSRGKFKIQKYGNSPTTDHCSLVTDRHGFTLIELIIVIVIASIIAGLTAMLLLEVMDVYSFVTIRESVLSDGELAMERMLREIRQIEDAQSIYTADVQEIDFEDAYQERIRFWVDGRNRLRRNAVNDGYNDWLATDLNSLTFKYWDKDNIELTPPVASPEDIKRIQIDFTIERGGEEVKLRSQVYPRSLR